MNNSETYIKSTLKNGISPYDIRQIPQNPILAISPFDKPVEPDSIPNNHMVHVYRTVPINTVFSKLGTSIDIKEDVPNPKFAISPWNNPNLTLDKDLANKVKCLL